MWTGSWLSHLGSGHASAGGCWLWPNRGCSANGSRNEPPCVDLGPRQVCSWALEKAGWEIKPRLKPHGRVCLPAWFGDPELLLFPPRDRAGLAMLGRGPKVTWKLGCRPQSLASVLMQDNSLWLSGTVGAVLPARVILCVVERAVFRAWERPGRGGDLTVKKKCDQTFCSLVEDVPFRNTREGPGSRCFKQAH